MATLPGADNFADATPFGYGDTAAPTPSGALTTEDGEPDVEDYGYNRSAWWVFTAPASEQVGLDTLLTPFADGADPYTYDTVIQVFTGTALGDLTQVVKGDDNNYTDDEGNMPHGYLSETTFYADEGTTYYVRVSSYPSAVDMDYVLRVGKRVYTYSEWIQPDQDIGIEAVVHQDWVTWPTGWAEHAVGTTEGMTTPPSTYGDVIDDALHAAFTTMVGADPLSLTDELDSATTINLPVVQADVLGFFPSDVVWNGAARVFAFGLSIKPAQGYSLHPPMDPTASDWEPESFTAKVTRAVINRWTLQLHPTSVSPVPDPLNLQLSVLTDWEEQNSGPLELTDVNIAHRQGVATWSIAAGSSGPQAVNPGINVASYVDQNFAALVFAVSLPTTWDHGELTGTQNALEWQVTALLDDWGDDLLPLLTLDLLPPRYRYIYSGYETAGVDVLVQNAKLTVSADPVAIGSMRVNTSAPEQSVPVLSMSSRGGS